MTKTETYQHDIYTNRMQIVENLLKNNPQNSQGLKNFPQMIQGAKKGILTPVEKEAYKAAFANYKNILNALFAQAVSDMYFKRSRLDLSNVFRFIMGGSINSGKFVDHVTNHCFSNLLSTVTIGGIQRPNFSYDKTITEQSILSENNFNHVMVKRSEDEYMQNRTPPHLLYLLLGFIFNTSVMEEEHSKYFNDKDADAKKYFVFVDMFADRTNIMTIALDRSSVYADVFFRLYLDELIEKLRTTINKMGGDDVKVKDRNRMTLYDPSDRKAKKDDSVHP